MTKTIVGLFDDFATANKAVQELTGNGINRDEVNITSQEGGAQNRTTANDGGAIGNFFNSLFGADASDEASNYAEAVRGGGAVVSVNAEDNQVERVVEILNRYGAVPINRRTEQHRASGFTGSEANVAYTREEAQHERETRHNTGEVAIPVVEEELRVGKRIVERGGVRIYSRTTERPVEETVHLREEHINVERRPVDRPVSDADAASLKGGVIEVTEMAEEAVIDKRARVVEEVVVNKETIAHDETVRDTVRRTDVEIEEIDTQRARGKSST